MAAADPSKWTRRKLLASGGAASLAGLAGGSLVAAPARALAEVAVPIPNAGFEEPVVNGVIPGWAQTFGTTPAFSVVSSPVYEGAQALLMDDLVDTSSAGLQSDPFAITGDRTCEITASVNRVRGVVWLYVYFYDSAGNQLTQVSGWFETPSDTWSGIALNAYAPPDATTMSVMIYSQIAPITRAYVDAVTVTMAEPEPEEELERNVYRRYDVRATPLWRHAADRGIIYGVADTYNHLSQDPGYAPRKSVEYAAKIAHEAVLLTTGDEFKWRHVRPEFDRYNFEEVDWLLAYTQQRHMLLRGHTLVWHQGFPPGAEDIIRAAPDAEQIMVDHISTVMGRFRGKMHSWDIVNEPFGNTFPPARPDDNLRTDSVWFEKLGPDYLDIAFHAARVADPDALLVMNDANDEWMPQRRPYVLRQLEGMLSRGVPIDAYGLESHLGGWFHGMLQREDWYAAFRAFLRDLGSLGLKILVTEADVSDRREPADFEIRDRTIADCYQFYLQAVLEEPAVIAVINWQLGDDYSYLQRAENSMRDDGLPQRPLPLDTDLKRKYAWGAIAKALDEAPPRELTTPVSFPRRIP